MDSVWTTLVEKGVSLEEIEMLKHSYLLLLMLPIVATIVGIGRHILGFNTLGTYVSIVLSFGFYEIGFENDSPDFIKGIKLGIALFFVVFATSALLYYLIIKKLRMHFIPKSSLVLTGVSISVILLLVVTAYYGKVGFIFLDVFSLIMIASISERLITIFAKKKLNQAISLSAQTLFLATLAFGLMSWDNLRGMLIEYPVLILLTIAINLLVGTYTGLRITEYWRFRQILLEEEPTVENENKPDVKK